MNRISCVWTKGTSESISPLNRDMAAAYYHIPRCLNSTNHVDIETLVSMSKALNAFDGAVLMISHNQGFLAGFCNELWILDKGKIAIKHAAESSFDDLFSEYRASALQSDKVFANRSQKADLAKRASRQTTGRQYGVLM